MKDSATDVILPTVSLDDYHMSCIVVRSPNALFFSIDRHLSARVWCIPGSNPSTSQEGLSVSTNQRHVQVGHIFLPVSECPGQVSNQIVRGVRCRSSMKSEEVSVHLMAGAWDVSSNLALPLTPEM